MKKKSHNFSMKEFQREQTDVIRIESFKPKSRKPSAHINEQGLLVLDLDDDHLKALKLSIKHEAAILFYAQEENERRERLESLLDAIEDAERKEAA